MSMSERNQTPPGPRVLLLSAMDRWIFQNLVPALRRTCSQVYAYPLGESMANWHHPNWPDLRRRLVDRFINDVQSIVRGPGLDLVLTVVYDDTLRPEDVRRLRNMGVRVVTYHVDMHLQWYRVLLHAPELDLLAISHMQNMEPLIRRGVQMHFMPMAASRDRYAPPASADVPAPGVLMLGSVMNPRVRAVAACRRVTDEVDVYGGGWDRLRAEGGPEAPTASPMIVQPFAKRCFDIRHYLVPRLMAEGSAFLRSRWGRSRPPSSEELEWASRARIHGHAPDADVPVLLGRAAITLGVNQRAGEIGDRFGFADSRLRDFEAPLSGAFYLVQAFVDLPLFYRPGVEVETWWTLGELAEKVRWYLDHPAERARIAAAGRERALRDHTWEPRLSALFHRLGLAARASEEFCPLAVPANLSALPWCGDAIGCEPSGGSSAVPAPELAAARPGG